MPHSVQTNNLFSSFSQICQFITHCNRIAKEHTPLQNKTNSVRSRTLTSTPRTKSTQKKPNCKVIEESEIRKLFFLTQKGAAETLKITEENLRKLCRSYGIDRWPYREISCEERYKLYEDYKAHAPNKASTSLSIKIANTAPQADSTPEAEGPHSLSPVPSSAEVSKSLSRSEAPSISPSLPSSLKASHTFTHQKNDLQPLPPLASLTLPSQTTPPKPEKLPPLSHLFSPPQQPSQNSQTSHPSFSFLRSPLDFLNQLTFK